MLKKENRLTKNRYFQYIYKKGEKVSSQNITLVYTPTKLKPIKIGITVSNKVGDAVTRNKIKRRIRAIVADNIEKINKKYNYIIVVRPSVAELDFYGIKKELSYLFKKGQFINENF